MKGVRAFEAQLCQAEEGRVKKDERRKKDWNGRSGRRGRRGKRKEETGKKGKRKERKERKQMEKVELGYDIS